MTSSPEQSVRVAVLGPVLVEDAHGALVEPPGIMSRCAITALLLAPRAQLSAAGLIDDLWADAPPRNEKAALQTLISRLRSVSAPGIIASANNGYRLALSAGEHDIGRARALRDTAHSALHDGENVAAERAATTALELWRGEPGADLGDTELAGRLASITNALRCELLHLRARARLERGDTSGALADLEPLAEASALDEDVQLLRMRAIAASGRRNDALRAFADFRERLRDELGTSPSAALVAFNTELLTDVDDAPAAAPIRIGLRTSPNELVGRDADIAAITDLVAHSRLTTILGVGGLGKTRLAQEVAARMAEQTPAVVFVELASVRTGDDVAVAFASTLGIGEAVATRWRFADPGARRDLRSRILAALTEQPTLLVIDNCEHIIDDAASGIADILDSTTSVRVLATSRAPLQIAAEHVYPLAPLSSTDETGTLPPAVALFLERARAARPSANLPVDKVARLCERLDGLPLAIELAAARIRSMSVEEISRRLDNRFALLIGGDRSAPKRHSTLRAVIEWSWELLSTSQQHMLRRLSSFPDGFSAEAAFAVAGGENDVTDELESLVNQSLVSVTDSALTPTVRYRMLETVREFGELALAEAGEGEQVAAAMYDWASELTERNWPKTYGPAQVQTFALISQEQDNLVSVLRSAIDERKMDVVVNVFVTLAFHWSIRGAHGEVTAFSGPVSAALDGYSPDVRHTEAAIGAWTIIAVTNSVMDKTGALRAFAHVNLLSRNHRFADGLLEMLVRLLLSVRSMKAVQQVLAECRGSDQPLVAGFANVISAQFSENAGDIDSAGRYGLAGYESAKRSGDSWLTGTAAQSLAQFYSQRARPIDALEWAGRAVPALRALEAEDDLRQLDWLVALNQVASGRIDDARAALERLAAADPESAGFDFADLRSIGLGGLAEIAVSEGRLGEARSLFARARDVYQESRRRGAPWSLTVTSGYIVSSVRAGEADDPETIASVRKLRTQIFVGYRIRTQFSDRPVLGSAVLGIAVWLLAPGHTGATEAERSIGFELLTLAHALAGREDLPTLNWAAARAEVEAAYPGADLDSVAARVNALTMDEREARTVTVLRDPVIRNAVVDRRGAVRRPQLGQPQT